MWFCPFLDEEEEQNVSKQVRQANISAAGVSLVWSVSGEQEIQKFVGIAEPSAKRSDNFPMAKEAKWRQGFTMLQGAQVECLGI